MLHRQHQKQRQRSHDHQQDHPPGRGRIPGALPMAGHLPDAAAELQHHVRQLLAIVDNNGNQRAQMQQHVEKQAGLLRRLKAQKILQ